MLLLLWVDGSLFNERFICCRIDWFIDIRCWQRANPNSPPPPQLAIKSIIYSSSYKFYSSWTRGVVFGDGSEWERDWEGVRRREDPHPWLVSSLDRHHHHHHHQHCASLNSTKATKRGVTHHPVPATVRGQIWRAAERAEKMMMIDTVPRNKKKKKPRGAAVYEYEWRGRRRRRRRRRRAVGVCVLLISNWSLERRRGRKAARVCAVRAWLDLARRKPLIEVVGLLLFVGVCAPDPVPSRALSLALFK